MLTFSQILRLIQRNTGMQNSSSSSYPLADQVVDVNIALNWYFILANRAAGNARPVDDTNQEDYPILYRNLVSGQNDYSFTVDADGNQILDFYKIRILNSDGITWTTLIQIDQDRASDYYLNPTTTGVPQYFYINSNGIFLVNPSNYNMVGGLEFYVARSPQYFTISDTTKVAGIPWVHHEYLALRPSYYFCEQKGLPQAGGRLKNGTYTGYLGNLKDMEADITKYYRDRNHGFATQITSEPVNSK